MSQGTGITPLWLRTQLWESEILHDPPEIPTGDSGQVFLTPHPASLRVFSKAPSPSCIGLLSLCGRPLLLNYLTLLGDPGSTQNLLCPHCPPQGPQLSSLLPQAEHIPVPLQVVFPHRHICRGEHVLSLPPHCCPWDRASARSPIFHIIHPTWSSSEYKFVPLLLFCPEGKSLDS